ncbi:hypothetical protein [Candidatus Palauibacter sp.]|uniref:hypothetical protein n=1 Tax=Candidatus Palauibacter sp. TaxID=3101350 RepID=UPI003B01EC02
MAVAFAASALFHAALLAWVTLEIPESGHAARGFERSGSVAEPAAERVIEVVRIQPPGVLPSGGSAGSSAGAAAGAATPAAPLPTELPAVSVRGAGTAAAAPVILAAAPVSPLALPAVGDLMAEAPAPASNRGVLRRRPESGAFPARGNRWTSSTSGQGFGGGGVTITGVGTDCITAGSGGAGIRTGVSLAGPGRGWGLGGSLGGGVRRMGWSGR